MRVDVYVASDDHQPKERERWTGYMVKAGDKYIVEASNVWATTYKAILITMVLALDRFVRPADITFHLENQWVIGKLIRPMVGGEEKPSVLDNWQENGWKTKRGTKVQNKDDWQRLYNKLRVFENSGAVFSYELLEQEDRNRHRILYEINRQRKEV